MKFLNIPLTFAGEMHANNILYNIYIMRSSGWVLRARIINASAKIMVAVGIEPLTSRY
jgi:hypothetical protein